MTDFTWATWAFWIAVTGVAYPYALYPVLLMLLRSLRTRSSRPSLSELPNVSIIVPVHNEGPRLRRKITNLLELDYPPDRLEVIIVSDGSTDDSEAIIRSTASPIVSLLALPARRGKAAALNAGLARAVGEIVVFTDASITLQNGSLRAIVRPFGDLKVGCVSGEDRIEESGGEGLYGRYELYLRRLESDVQSIVGASGSFYAQRRHLSGPFTEGMAPDFLSVLRTVEQGYRAVSAPDAIGDMSSVKDPRHEFDRKVRTLLRGMTALFAHKQLLNPLQFGLFAIELWSHKVLRWAVPFCLITALLAPLALLGSPFYLGVFIAQVLFYGGALAALAQWGNVHRSLPGRVALYFSSVNIAILTAWFRYGSGARQELWTPSQR